VGTGEAEALARHRGGGATAIRPPCPPVMPQTGGRPSRLPPRGVSRLSRGSPGMTTSAGIGHLRLAVPTFPVRVHLSSGSRDGGRRALRASSLPASVARGTTSCRSHPSMGSGRARNCMTPASRATCATSAALSTLHLTPRALPFPGGFYGARRGGRGIPCICLRALVYRFRVGFHQGPWGDRGASPACPCTSPFTGPGSAPSVSPGSPQGRDLPPCLRRGARA